jgi:predicted O-methyltransferase YrrM
MKTEKVKFVTEIPTKEIGTVIIVSKISDDPEGLGKYKRKDIQVNDYLAEVYSSGYIKNNKDIQVKFVDVTNPLEGRHLYNLVRDNKFTHTLEIGLAMGASAAWICEAHKQNGIGGMHTAIDPNQHTQYDSMGIELIKRCGLYKYLKLMELPSYRALPKLVEQVIKGTIPRFQLIYIDGWHTFDSTVLDFYYADLILEVGGVIVLDDIKHRSVSKAFKYFVKNYPHYRLVTKTPVYTHGNFLESSQATFIKIGPDTRSWNFHKDF